MNKENKKCPYCMEEIKIEAIKCKHCGELLNSKKNENSFANVAFAKYDNWIKQNYPVYNIVTQNEKENYIVLNKTYKPFNPIICLLLCLLWVLPGIIYAMATLSGNKTISLTIYFDKTGKAIKIDNKKFKFLIDKYNKT